MSEQEFYFSPLDTRYKKFLPYSLSENAWVEAQVEVEKKWLLTLADEGFVDKLSEKEIEKIFAGVNFAEIEEIEKTTQHATRALIEVLIHRLEKAKKTDHAQWVHVGLTSFDAVDTAQRLRLKKYFYEDFCPVLDGLKAVLLKIAKTHQKLEQVGRTHGQWAVPSYFSLNFLECLERVNELDKKLIGAVDDLRGQASGAVGAYQALGLLVKDPVKTEEKFLKRLGLKPHLGSTQIIPPEDILFVAQIVFMMASVLTKLANDLRHLARSEIFEIAEGLKPGQVGSSTMPQKRNPWNLEHVCSLHKVLQSRLSLMQDDIISEHQRDLTNSASQRFYSEFFCINHLLLKRFLSVLESLQVNGEALQKNLDQAGASVFAEAFYVLATKNGHKDAHSLVREASREAEKSGKDLLTVLQQKKIIDPSLDLKKLKAEVLKGPKQKLQHTLKRSGD